MRLHRFVVPGLDLRADTLGIADRDLAHQLRSVLRVKVGEQIIVCDGDGTEAVGTVREYREDAVIIEFAAPYELTTEPPRTVRLCVAVTKRDTFEWACQKATECGATKIIPVISERTVKQNLNLKRLRSIVREAAEQSGRGVVPEIGEITKFEELVAFHAGERYIAALGDAANLADVYLGDEVTVAIGPEGGFSEREVAAAEENGWVPVSLGSRVLRAETAAAVAAYLAAR
jgi:16S rRNA (uracil1498-N3)-methyltransferase